MSNRFISGYRDHPGIDSRANAALIRINRIADDVSIPSAVRLLLIAEVMGDEPIQSDGSPAAHEVRNLAQRWR
jgi:hypothetical protein